MRAHAIWVHSCSCIIFSSVMASYDSNSKSLEDICDYLESKGFSEAVVDAFNGQCIYSYSAFAKHLTILLPRSFIIEQELDGDAIAVGLASSTGPDWLKDVVPKMGLRLKVHSALHSFLLKSQVSYRQTLMFL